MFTRVKNEKNQREDREQKTIKIGISVYIILETGTIRANFGLDPLAFPQGLQENRTL
ncbi:MAG: hypothetical protein OIN86_09905 [Candidatus Methanoperedens sp.]|nr:hypothetical protein [Candidatus Methanoperedens sp.]CAG0982072.1 hypothetical protein METP1_01830 [Methanosarcinales archaeon]